MSERAVIQRFLNSLLGGAVQDGGQMGKKVISRNLQYKDICRKKIEIPQRTQVLTLISV